MRAIAENSRGHEIVIALNGQLPESIESIRSSLYGIVSQGNIRVFSALDGASQLDSNPFRMNAAELLREQFIAGLDPDALLITSLFEGWGSNAVSSIGMLPAPCLTAVILHDLIPLAMDDRYLREPAMRSWYYRKSESLKRADLVLSVSRHSKDDASRLLGIEADRIAVIGAAVSHMFQHRDIADDELESIKRRCGISKDFIMAGGNIYESHKNIEQLVYAYGKLPKELKDSYQLVLFGKGFGEGVDKITTWMNSARLSIDNIATCGHVTDDELVALYNAASLVVVPSLYEGFGFPVLEAMSCGTPVICSDATSLPEVAGCDKMLFDPYDTSSIASKMRQVLEDSEFARFLSSHGLERAGEFSWDKVAESVLVEIERQTAQKESLSLSGTPNTVRNDRRVSGLQITSKEKPRLAMVSPMPPSQTGIASYTAELLEPLLDYYDIDVITQSQHKISPIPGGAANHLVDVHKPEWFLSNAESYERVIYQVGNSPFHDWQLDLIGKCPGVVVLHDFVLEGLYRGMESAGRYPHARVKESYYSHGYEAIVPGISKKSDGGGYPMNRSILEQALGVIVHSQYAKELASEYYGDGAGSHWAVVPQLRGLPASLDMDKGTSNNNIRHQIGVGDGDLLICSFGIVAPTKLNHMILDALAKLDSRVKKKLHLVLVGGRFDDTYTTELDNKISSLVNSGWDIRSTGWVTDHQYEEYLIATDIAIQLRSDTRGESSRAVLDCLAHGIPTIINPHRAAGEIPPDVAVMLSDDFKVGELVSALSTMVSDSKLRADLSRCCAEYIAEVHSPARVAELYYEAVERFYAHALSANCGYVLSGIADIAAEVPHSENDLLDTCSAMAWNRVRFTRKQLLVDVSAIADHDLRTGIQRVTRAVLNEMFSSPQLPDLRIEPVYAANRCYSYAQKFTCSMLGIDGKWAGDGALGLSPGDIFFGLDWAADKVPERVGELAGMRRKDVGVYFFVHDLLPIMHPEWFPPEMQSISSRWIRSVYDVADGVICNSMATASTVRDWVKSHGKRSTAFKIGYCHLGSDIESSIPTGGMDGAIDGLTGRLGEELTFLVVGTLEPRKGHSQVLSAFEQLWREGRQVNLVFAGKQGWMMEDLVRRINSHSELDRHLHWLEGLSDEALARLYNTASCLIASSYDEGFGLPIVEAARHGVPVIARDIPVFREIAGDGALYFDGLSPNDITSAIEHWLELYQADRIPSPRGIIQQSWSSVASTIAGMLFDESHPNWLYILSGL